MTSSSTNQDDSKFISESKFFKDLEKLRKEFHKRHRKYQDYKYTSQYLSLSQDNIEELYKLTKLDRDVTGYRNNKTKQKNYLGVESKYWGSKNTPLTSIYGYSWENGDVGLIRGWNHKAPLGVDSVKMIIENSKSSRLPNTRVISNEIANMDSLKLNSKINQLLTFWGQFMDHDFSISNRAVEKQVIGTYLPHNDELFEENKKTLTSIVGGRVGMFIYDKEDSTYKEVSLYDNLGSKKLYLVDSKKPICDKCRVYQLNGIDSYLSCNTIYSSDKNIQWYLRESKRNHYGELIRDFKGQLIKTRNLLSSKIIGQDYSLSIPTYGEVLQNNGVNPLLLKQVFEANDGRGCSLESGEWKQIENDPYFIHWLDVPDRNTVEKYGQAMMSEVNSRVNLSFKDLDKNEESHTWGAGMLICHYCSGDVRVNEHLGLTGVHNLLFCRHYFHSNNIKNTCQHYGLKYSEDSLFAMSKLLVIADFQHITCTEYMDTLLGKKDKNSKEYLLNVDYDEDVDASISTEFSSAAFRLGHMQVQDQLLTKLELVKAFLDPHITHKIGFSLCMVELLYTRQKVIDGSLTDTLRNKLLGSSGKEGAHLDLYATNIMRGRESGITSYTKLRNCLYKYGGKHSNKGYYAEKYIKKNPLLKPIRSWDDTKGVFREGVLEKLRGLYKEVSDIDLFVGLMSEKPMSGSLLGPSCSYLIREQLFRLTAGDRCFYTHIFSDSLKEKVSSLKDIILECVDSIKLRGSDNAFEIQESNRNKYIKDFEEYPSHLMKLQYKTIFYDF